MKLGSTPQWDAGVAGALVQALDFVPLAVSQAAAYIRARAPRSSLETYLREFQQNDRKRAKLLEHEIGDLRRDGGASNAILTTWQISFDYIRLKQPSAADLLALMSFFDRQGIPEWVLKASQPTKEAAQASGRGTGAGVADRAAAPATAANPTSPTTNPITTRTRIHTVDSKMTWPC